MFLEKFMRCGEWPSQRVGVTRTPPGKPGSHLSGDGGDNFRIRREGQVWFMLFQAAKGITKAHLEKINAFDLGSFKVFQRIAPFYRHSQHLVLPL